MKYSGHAVDGKIKKVNISTENVEVTWKANA
jgi:hypothetical protein